MRLYTATVPNLGPLVDNSHWLWAIPDFWLYVTFLFLLQTAYPLGPSLHLYSEPPPKSLHSPLLLVVNKEEKLTFCSFPSWLSSQQPLALLTSTSYSFLFKLCAPSTEWGIPNLLDCIFTLVKEIKMLVKYVCLFISVCMFFSRC